MEQALNERFVTTDQFKMFITGHSNNTHAHLTTHRWCVSKFHHHIGQSSSFYFLVILMWTIDYTSSVFSLSRNWNSIEMIRYLRHSIRRRHSPTHCLQTRDELVWSWKCFFVLPLEAGSSMVIPHVLDEVGRESEHWAAYGTAVLVRHRHNAQSRIH